MIITPESVYENWSKGSDKKVELKCDDCGKRSTTTYNNYNNGQKRREFSGETYCKSCTGKKLGKNRVGKKSWNKGKKLPQYSGENSPSWKGGEYVSSDGYWMVYQGHHDTDIKWNNYKKKHLVVAEEKLGRKLKKGEIVHHIDCNKLNNDPDNLDIIKSEKQHRQAHLSLEQIAILLLQRGFISYDNGIYVANEELEELINGS